MRDREEKDGMGWGLSVLAEARAFKSFISPSFRERPVI